MATINYRLTVDSATGTITKIERVDGEGGYKEIDLSKLRLDLGSLGGAAIVVNIYGGGPVVSPTGGVKVTGEDDFCICFPPPNPPGRAR